MQASQVASLGLVTLVISALAIANSGGAVTQSQKAPSGDVAPTGSAGAGAVGAGATSDPCDVGTAMIARYDALYPRLPGPSGAASAESGRRFHHLIVLVPDPIATDRSDAFDSALEGIEEAVAGGIPVADGGSAVGYVRDHYWCPWPGSDDKKARRCWQGRPGVLLYRPTGDPRTHPAVLVLLAGETPTWGVRKDQLEAAIRLVVKEDALEPSDAGPELRIVGPTFSGSAPSLAAALRDRPVDAGPDAAWPTHFSMVSGTATNPNLQKLLENVGDAATAKYESTTPTDDKLLVAMWTFLEARGAHGPVDGEPGNAVLLTESVTAYGEGVAAQDDGGSSCGPSAPCFEQRKFPLDLASVREAEGDVDADAPATPTRAPGELSEDTPFVHGLELGEVLRELSRNDARFVGLVATDPRDVLFLAQRIRDDLPDVRLFTLASDIRYLDASHARALDGMLIAHSANDDRRGTRSIALANDTVRSVYFAARRVLGEGEREKHVEISLVGNGGLWQIGPDEGAVGAGAGPLPRNPRPMSWAFVRALMLGLFAIVLGAIVSPWVGDQLNRISSIGDLKTTGFLRHRGSLWTLIGRCAHLDLAADDGLVSAALLVVAACPALLMLASGWGAAGFSELGPNVVLAIAVMILGATWTLAVSRVLTARACGAGTNWSAVVLSSAATVAGLFGLRMASEPPRETTFNLLSGASPVLAGILGFTTMGVGLWCWRVRLRFLDSHRFGVTPGPDPLFGDMVPPIAQALGEGDPKAESHTGIDEIERRLLEVIRTPWTTFMVVPILVHLLLAASVIAPIWVCVLLVERLRHPHRLEGGLERERRRRERYLR